MICYENKNSLLASCILGGYDPYLGPQVYAITVGGSIIEQKFSVSGSGSGYIYGYL